MKANKESLSSTLSRMATQKDSEIDKLETVDEPNLIKNQTDFSRSALYGSDALEELGVISIIC